jgi:predicted tellurium resistance membrane protein TerC
LIQNTWILIVGGLYLIYVAVSHLFRFKDETNKTIKKKSIFSLVVAQIIFADIIFSIDNVISAVGISHTYSVVVTGV